ncbi:MAG: trehalose-phosphatase [Thermomicrobiales bacterium]
MVTDIDGTINPIAPTPAEAMVDPGARAALQRLAARLAAVASLRARSAAGAAMVELPELIYVGNHGLERIVRGEAWTHPVAAASATGHRRRAGRDRHRGAGVRQSRLARSRTRASPGPFTIAWRTIHSRRRRCKPFVRETAARHGLRVTSGRMIFELRRNLAVNKGSAIRDLVHDLGLRSVVFFGDDVTDVDAFRALREMRAHGVATLRVGVLGNGNAREANR